MNPKRRQNHRVTRKIMYGTIITGVFIPILSVFTTNPIIIRALIIFSVSIATFGIVYGLLFLRCPYCEGLLNMKGFSPDYCQHCGKKLD